MRPAHVFWPFLPILAACEHTPEPSEPPTAAPYDLRFDRARQLEFVRAPVTYVGEGPEGRVDLGLGPMARAFAILPAHPDAAAMSALAREAHASGAAVYATLDVSQSRPKSPEAVRDGGGPTPIVRLAPTPDPRAWDPATR